MDSRSDFNNIIRQEYFKVVGSTIPENILIHVSQVVSDYYFEQYVRFKNQYPKSIKRYSKFDIKDLNHPTTFELVIKAVKEIAINEYENYSIHFLKMTLEELREFERNRNEFYKMF
jgi:hypothetical protein